MSSALDFAVALIAAATDPKATRQRLEQMAAAEQRVKDAVRKHQTTREAAEAAMANTDKRAGELSDRARDLAVAEQRSQQRQTELDVAARAAADREQKVTKAEAELTAKQAEHAKAVKAHADRVAALRQTLA
jgi:hypothetical protein